MAIATACVDQDFRDTIPNLFRRNHFADAAGPGRSLSSELHRFQSRAKVKFVRLQTASFGRLEVLAGLATPGEYFDWRKQELLPRSANLLPPPGVGHMSGGQRLLEGPRDGRYSTRSRRAGDYRRGGFTGSSWLSSRNAKINGATDRAVVVNAQYIANLLIDEPSPRALRVDQNAAEALSRYVFTTPQSTTHRK